MAIYESNKPKKSKPGKGPSTEEKSDKTAQSSEA